MVQQLNNSNFNETINSNDVVLVDFYADWCGPCQALKPTLDSLASDFDGKAIISKINVDANPELSAAYGVRSIPALFYFKKGELIGRQLGVQSKGAIEKNLKNLLNNQS